MEIRQLLISNIKAHNKYLTDEILDKMSEKQLIANCHPILRSEIKRLKEL